MKELIVAVVKVVAPISVALIVFAQGLGISPQLVAIYFKERPLLMLRSLCAVLLLVPGVGLVVILVMKPVISTAIGLAILLACPPAPLMLRTGPARGKANEAFMASLHLCLAALAFLTVPVVLYVISIPLGFRADVDVGAMTIILARTIVVPLGLGLVVRGFLPQIAGKLSVVLGKVGMGGLALVVLFATVAIFPALLKVGWWSYVVMAAVSAIALAIGHWLGPDDPHEKTALAVECAIRHPALAVAIGVANFGREPALRVLLPCAVTFTVVATIYLAWRGKSASRGRPGSTHAPSAGGLTKLAN